MSGKKFWEKNDNYHYSQWQKFSQDDNVFVSV